MPKKKKKATKLKKEEIETPISDEQKRILEEQRQKSMEIQNIRNEIDEMSKKADRLAREYEVALRKGRFELKCPYPEIINIFKIARKRSIENGLDTEATIYLSQIQAFISKLEKDNKLRQIEAEKALKQKQAKDILKMPKEEKKIAIEDEKLRQKMGKTGRQEIEDGKFSINKRNEKLKAIFDECVN